MIDATLSEVLDDYLSTQALRDATKFKHRFRLKSKCSDVLDKPISYFTEEVLANLRVVLRGAGGNHGAPATTIIDTLVRYADRKRQLVEYAQQENRGIQSEEITLLRVYTDYVATGRLKPTTQRNYQQRLSYNLPDWMNLPVNEITKQMVEDRHREISLNSPSMANSVFRSLRALLNYAAIKYEDSEGLPIVRANPTRRLSELKQWNRDYRRQSVIQISQVGLFFRTVWTLNDKTARDILLTLLCTGLRHGEVATLEWSQLDLELGLLHIPREKSKNNEPLVIPLSDFVWRLLAERRFAAECNYVFPGRNARREEMPIANIQRSINLVKQRSGIQFMPHDLRRGFVSIADELELDQNVIKNLINHHNPDITESYTIRSQERLRRVTQQITSFILGQAAIAPGANVHDERMTAALKKIFALPMLTNLEVR